jgi:Lhr-like helicase/predicted RecB family nuclease
VDSAPRINIAQEACAVSASPLHQLPNTYRAFYGAFPALRPFQIEVITPLLQGHDLILQAATGSGKTEAVLAPCLERVLHAEGAAGVLYVVPTRALAQDLRRRLEPVLHERLGLRLGLRTGDVKRLPAGTADVLLTTPESLDVMLGSPNREVRDVLRRVNVLIIDEVHQFLAGYRGRHLAYLVQRLARRGRRYLQKIALSATVAEPEAIKMAFGFRPDTVCVRSGVQRQILPRLVYLQREDEELVAFIDDLVERFGHRKLLLFANSRSRCDRLFALLRRQGRLQATTYLHYSNLKPRQRQEVERQFQRRAQALCIATSTLELGIDIGDVDGVVLYEPPESVTTFVQRLGRANRQAHHTTFWGICRGPRADEQLLQFLALYQLAQQGVVEARQPGDLPSVLVQQVLSCLYEQKSLASATLHAVFPQQAAVLPTLLPTLAARAWLRRTDGAQASWRGGWRYARALRARQIWSNFPDTEVEYVLEVDGEAVADVPASIVRQLAIGDHVDLAGRRLRILDVQDDERKVVRATPAQVETAKELLWLGSGPPVSWEVAQAVQQFLNSDGASHDAPLLQGLFARPRALLQRQLQRAQRRVVLQNGVEVSRTPQGLYRYATYLGSLGNLMLQRTIAAYYESRLEDMSCTSDALAVECTHPIDLQALPLPVGREAFTTWVAQHLQALQAFLPLNTFCQALPRTMLVAEITDWLWDERLSQVFARYRQLSCAIVQGDPRHLEWDETSESATERSALPVALRQGPRPSILEQEKLRLGLNPGMPPQLPVVPVMHQTPRALTGTMLSTYMQHHQCDRLLSFECLPFAQQPPKRTLVDSTIGAARAGQGRAYEARVLAWLPQQGAPLYRIPDQEDAGQRLSLQVRQARTVQMLQSLIDTFAGSNTTAQPVSQTIGYLVQPVLLQDSCLSTDQPVVRQVDGVGIPDLLEVTVQDATVWLTVADIKDSPAPRYAQKWQVAWYAALLEAWVRAYTFALPVQVAASGVLLTRPQGDDPAPTRHAFALAPYLAALPLLQQRIGTVLTTPVLEAAWQLQPHCGTCAYVDTCSRQAFSADDIMLLPDLTPGEHLKLRTLGLSTLPQAARRWQEEGAAHQNVLSPQQVASLGARVRALTDNRLEVLADTTSLYPGNIGMAIFLHVVRDPRHEQLRVWGLYRSMQGTPAEAPYVWVAADADEAAACRQAFVDCLRAWWQEAIAAGQGPHVVVFAADDLRLLQEAIPQSVDPTGLDFLWSGERHTSLRQLLRQHFALPVPLRASLATAAQVWGLTPVTGGDGEGRYAPCADAVAPDDTAVLLQDALAPDQVHQLKGAMETHLRLLPQLWQSCTAVLRSDWQQQHWDATTPESGAAMEAACADFLVQQRRWRERDMVALQRLPLRERVERYRALGPLTFETTNLDPEGRFLYYFRLPPEATPGRFRPGDFLKLNAVGNPDLQEGQGVILAHYEPHAGHLAVLARQGRPALHKHLAYALDEDLDDWTTPKVLHAVHEVFTAGKHPPLTALLSGTLPLERQAPGLAWAQDWVQQMHLNVRQQEAVLLPFQRRLGLIEGPPGTGKTHVLACMLITLVLEAWHRGFPLRLAVSALTHQAIDNLLAKVHDLLRSPLLTNFPGRCLKWGQRLMLSQEEDRLPLTYVDDAADILAAPYVILGATGFGFYQMFDSQAGAFPAFFDWIVLDEASQMLIPQALLSLVYGKGQYIFCGDVQQLPPVVLGPQPVQERARMPCGDAVAPAALPAQSILAHLLTTYGPQARVRLNTTYRLNQALCELPSQLWYQGDLHPTAANATRRLEVPVVRQPDLVDAILAPQYPVALVLADHTTDAQQSALEAEIVATLAARLLLDYGVAAARLAILAPHRAQNSAIAQRLAQLLSQRGECVTLPVIDTVERLQGAERDVVLFSVTSSDPDALDSPFLNNPNRFNVAITRARHKLVVVGSRAFFTQVPHTDTGLQAHYAFKAYYHRCRSQRTLFNWPQA